MAQTTIPNELTQLDLVQHRFVPTVVYVREDNDFHTRISIYNYFSELFPKVQTGATANLWFFDANGQVVAERQFALPFRGQLQYELSELGRAFEGTAGASLIPETIPEFKHEGVGTGYYVSYYDTRGHADHSHEWGHMRFRSSMSPPWICTVRPNVTPDTSLILMNCYYGTDPTEGSMRCSITLRNGQGQALATRELSAVPPRGMTRVHVQTLFPDIEKHASRETTLSIEVTGTNMQGPFTFVRAPNGDFNIHHFC